MKYIAAMSAIALITAATVSHAQEVGKYGFSLGISSVGLTGEVAYRHSEKWRVRAMLSGAPKYRSGEDLGGISYDTTSKLRGLSLLADRQLGQSNWRLTFGAFVSDTEAAGTANGTFQIGNNIYTTKLDAIAKFENRVSPIIAIGYDYPIGQHWIFSGSAGYIYTGGVSVGFSSTNPILPGDLVLEKLQAEADIGNGYPFIEIGMTYHF
ncbi:hypothetical protein FAP39_06810 [Shimia litoralis]|uniref:Porin family protein n=1 Tax=Shimia litoralis TaxID=420403 RepID=A0A4U7N6D6_9RHOB|nr:hypothetical protein [Shimia litoralis]TKZ21442.1 hypothetical protein FAP39_06810 [Shimia litoralis]